MAGRDIGTVVLPDADLKIFLRASAEERARRRYQEAVAQRKAAKYENILAAIIARDEQDKTNPVSPTKPARDAVIVNTDGLSIKQVVVQLEQLVVNNKNGTQ
jgi:cytidylate kinase